MAALSSVISIFLSVLFFFTNISAMLPTRAIIPKNAEEVKLSLAVISDTHIDEAPAREAALTQGFKALSDDDIDAVVVSGDLTDHGREVQYERFYSCVKNGLNGPQFIASVGNHDTWNDETDNDNRAEFGLKCFMDYYNDYTGRNIDKPYYTTVINGYSVICLSSFSDGTDAYIPDEEIEWLDTELEKATADGLPVFVISHWPINGVNGSLEIWEDSGIGNESDKIEEVLNKYTNVFYIFGHTHTGFMGCLTERTKGYASIEKKGNVQYINVPCFMYFNTDAGYLLSGCGYIIEVYENQVVFRARNVLLSNWLPYYNAEIPID